MKAPEGKAYVIGRVIDENEDPISYASVSLHQLPDSALVDGQTTNERGGFRLTPDAGSYFVKVSFLSFSDLFIDVLNHK